MTDTNDKESVALSSVVASAFMAAAKLVVGLMTGSLGILSEAAHSLLDLGAAGLTYFAVRVSDHPADDDHHYGHGKIESVSALVETGLLFVTGALILREAVLRLLADSATVEVTWYAVAVIVVSIVIDVGRSRALMKVAKATKSQALEADALHFASDILSSAAVLVGLGCVAAGYPKGDAIAAIAVSIVVFRVGYDMGKRTVNVLIDAAPEGIADRVAEIARGVAGVARVEQVRARPAGASVFVDVLIRVSRTMPLDAAREVCDAVAAAISRSLPEAIATVKAEPIALDTESVIDTVRIAASRLGLMVHDIGVHSLGGKTRVGFDIEVDENMNIQEAHAIADRAECEIRKELGGDVQVDTHIDPRRFNVVIGSSVGGATLTDVESRIREAAGTVKEIVEVRDIGVQKGDDGLYVSLACLFAPETSVRIVHGATVSVETQIRHSVHGISRVVVHAEPAPPAPGGAETHHSGGGKG